MSLRDQYRLSGKLDVFTQLALARKLAPAIPIVDIQLKAENKDKPKGILVVMMLSQLDDTNSQYVVNKSLSIVLRKQADGNFTRVQMADGTLMFDDLVLSDILELVSWVIEENLGDFLRTALIDSAP